MKLYAFIGESGSGKSYRAMWLANSLGIKYVIDDGLLISGGKVVAGSSAKKEKTKMGSTKKAIFWGQADADEMKRAIKKNGVKTLLILATSDRMADRIAERLKLGKIEKYINIHDIASEEEISTAKRIRNTLGMHVIPVPTMAIKKDFQGYFWGKLEILLAARSYKSEKTVMRPSYSYLGDYSVDRSVIAEICRHEAEKEDGVKVKDILIFSAVNGGVNLRFYVELTGIRNIKGICSNIQNKVGNAMEEYLGMVTEKIDITVSNVFKKEGEK